MRIQICLSLFLYFGFIHAQSVDYKLSMPKPQNHQFHVEMTLNDFKEKTLDVSLPVWAPGSYLVREFSKNINLVKAFDEKGNPLDVHKKKKNTWTITKGKQSKVIVKYEVLSLIHI